MRKEKIFIIAEAGVNHNGDIALAKELIDAAVDAKVDAVKFQTWKTELLVTQKTKQADYQAKNSNRTESQFDMLKKLELSYDDFRELKEYCDKKNIMFLSTPDEETSASFLCDLQEIFKIGSGELTNIPFLRFIGRLKKSIILSTGMSTLAEVGVAIETLVGAGTSKEAIVVLHATTQYPTVMEDVNLAAMGTIAKAFEVKVGYSDHTLGIEIPVAAAALGAVVLEKHFTLDKSMDGPDHKASLNPVELVEMVKAVRNVERAIGTGLKEPTLGETKIKRVIRKAIVARENIQMGSKLTEKNLTVKRNDRGISASRWDEIVDGVATQDYKVDDPII